jgi:hypothetical protein
MTSAERWVRNRNTHIHQAGKKRRYQVDHQNLGSSEVDIDPKSLIILYVGL